MGTKITAKSLQELVDSEREKYVRVWGLAEYREQSPALRNLADILLNLAPARGARIIDLGCGTAEVAAVLRRRGYDVEGVDIAFNACTNEVPVDVSPLHSWDPDRPFEHGYCVDVMEHLPAELRAATLRNIARHVTRSVYFRIATFPDEFGTQVLGVPLHLSHHVSLSGWINLCEKFWPHVHGLTQADAHHGQPMHCLLVSHRREG